MNIEELIERLKRDYADNFDIVLVAVTALREQRAEIELFRKLYADEGRKAVVLLEEISRLKAEIERQWQQIERLHERIAAQDVEIEAYKATIKACNESCGEWADANERLLAEKAKDDAYRDWLRFEWQKQAAEIERLKIENEGQQVRLGAYKRYRVKNRELEAEIDRLRAVVDRLQKVQWNSL